VVRWQYSVHRKTQDYMRKRFDIMLLKNNRYQTILVPPYKIVGYKKYLHIIEDGN
jgi:hypothetical protein